VTGPGDRDGLFGTRWIHMFEEDTAEGEVYRPETDDVPLSRRPRRRIELSEDGSARIVMPGPDDRPVESSAAWQKEGGDLMLRGYPRGRGDPTVLRIVSHSPTRLVIRKSKPT
jgi:hypothetical protein